MSDPPARWLNAEAAARYICVRVDALRRFVRAGKLPEPSRHLGPRSPRYDREAIDAAFEGRQAAIKVEQTTAEIVQRIHAAADAKAARKAERARSRAPKDRT